MAKTVKRRSYKNFKEKVDWSAVYYCDEVDHAVEVITNLFIEVIDNHAPWITFQQRNMYRPWETSETIALMKLRDKAKADASTLAKAGLDVTPTWIPYKSLRNKVRNRIKYEEINYKHN